MKILFFANTDWYLYNFRLPLAKALRERGHRVVLIAPPGKYIPKLIEAGFECHEFPIARKGMNPITELVTIFRFITVLRKYRPDVLHLFTIKPVLYGSIAARFVKTKQVINAITGLGYAFSEDRSMLRTIVTTLYRFSLWNTTVVFQNPDDMGSFLEHGLSKKEQTILIPGSGVDTDIFQPLDEPSGVPIVMLAGRLLRAKGVPEFVEAAKILKKRNVDCRFVLVGEPYPDNPDSIEEKKLLDWQEKGLIEWWGWRDDMRAVIPQAAVFCLPTRYKEGLPRVLTEASSCARPAVTTDIPGCNMAVRDGENGFLVPPGDAVSLADALETLLKDPALRKAMGKRGREIAENEFSLHNIHEKTLAIYEKIEKRPDL